jgi:hypothetical protein
VKLKHLSPQSGQTPPPSPHTLVPLPLFLSHEMPLKLPPALSCLKMRALGALVRAPADESSESPTYTSCSKTIKLQAQIQELISYKKGIQHPTYMYQADSGTQPLVRTFLRGGMDSSRPDKDVMAVTARTSKICWTSRQGARPISSPCAYGGIASPLVVRSYPHRKKLPG